MTLHIPRHVGLIIDGNGRWATRRGLARLTGHQVGLHHIRTILPSCYDFGIEIVSGYLWSTENWRRPAEEVAHMRDLLCEFGPSFAHALHEQNVRIVHTGSREGLSKEELAVLDEAVWLTRNNGPAIFNAVFNYGGRQELVRAAQRIAARLPSPDAITEEVIASELCTVLPDLDLVIRTSGECRVSNFLLWQSAGAVFYVTKTCWPDVTHREIAAAIRFYQQSNHMCRPRLVKHHGGATSTTADWLAD